MNAPRNPLARKLGQCKTAAEYHRLLVVTRCKTGSKPGRTQTHKHQGVPQ